MPIFERQFFTPMTVERREEKVGKPLLTGSALGGDKFSGSHSKLGLPVVAAIHISA